MSHLKMVHNHIPFIQVCHRYSGLDRRAGDINKAKVSEVNNIDNQLDATITVY